MTTSTERDALRRIMGEVDLALSGAVPPQETKGPIAEWEFWGPRAMAVYNLPSTP